MPQDAHEPSQSEPGPDFFSILGLDPEEEHAETVLRAALNQSHHQWQHDLDTLPEDHPGYRAAHRHLGLLPEIEQVMLGDPVARGREAQRAVALREQAAIEAAAQARRSVQLLLAKGYLLDQEAEMLTRRYGPALAGLAEVLTAADRRGEQAEPQAPVRWAPRHYQRLHAELAEIGHDSLYALLGRTDPGLGPDSPLEALAEAARALRDSPRSAGAADPRTTLVARLAGEAAEAFATADTRAAYDTSRDLAELDRIALRYMEDLSAARRVSLCQAELFLREAAEAGYADPLARAVLADHTRSRGWPISLPLTPAERAVSGRTPCPGCGVDNEARASRCTQCDVLLAWPCPLCSSTVRGEPACAQCGFPVGDQPRVARLLDEADARLRAKDPAGARARVDAARALWPLDPAADDPTVRRIVVCTKLVETAQAEAEQTSATVTELVAARRFVAARDLLQHAEHQVPDWAAQLARVNAEIRRADQRLARAQRAKPAQQENLLGKLLADCVDHPEAKAALRMLPALPAASVRLRRQGRTVQLSWEPSPTAKVRYVVMRRVGSRPPHTTLDGFRVGATRQTTLVDGRPPEGVPLWYTIFVERLSHQPVQEPVGSPMDEPVLIDGEILITRMGVASRTVSLMWQPPSGATEIVAERWPAGTESDGRDTGRPGEPVPASFSGLEETDLRDGVAYTYRIRAGYHDARGRTSHSAGVEVTLTPQRRPVLPAPPRTGLRPSSGTSRLNELILDWDQPDRGSILLMYQNAEDVTVLSVGEVVDPTRLAVRGQEIRGDGRHYQHVLPRQGGRPGPHYYFPVLLRNDVGFVGTPRRYAALPPVTGVRAQGIGQRLRLRWDWPPGCSEVLICAGTGDVPPHPDAEPAQDSHCRFVTEQAYRLAGFEDINFGLSALGQRVTAAIHAVSRHDGQPFTSVGTVVDALLQVDLGYTIVPDHIGRWPRRRPANRLTLKVNVPHLLPRLLVVRGYGGPPISREDGTPVQQLREGRVDSTWETVLSSDAPPDHLGVFPLDYPDTVVVRRLTDDG
ncbi:hypothetical protein FAIPA1_140112 [Frankia sp. AiPs1]|uniref:zinc finger Ran-binding domain-containing protein n=1 Tax=Frankia sp. AiPa1 TaxID=573492 RepID=UPI00202B99CC|nr:zinc finger Ran-binding domain-containing protein [Frankia sp. AiPa1]MCL9760257.1 zinc finger Ran-binding domain-containing protein [Frankia sp. AiPa1]